MLYIYYIVYRTNNIKFYHTHIGVVYKTLIMRSSCRFSQCILTASVVIVTTLHIYSPMFSSGFS